MSPGRRAKHEKKDDFSLEQLTVNYVQTVETDELMKEYSECYSCEVDGCDAAVGGQLGEKKKSSSYVAHFQRELSSDRRASPMARAVTIVITVVRTSKTKCLHRLFTTASLM